MSRKLVWRICMRCRRPLGVGLGRGPGRVWAVSHGLCSRCCGLRDRAFGGSERISYRIDSKDRLTWVSSEWHDFARNNEAKELTPEAVIGQELWQFIRSVDTQHLYGQLFDRIRSERVGVRLPFRCDSPTVRRSMQLDMWSLPAGAIHFSATLLDVEARPYAPVLDAGIARAGPSLAACSLCKRIRPSGQCWCEVEVVEPAGSHVLPELEHVICSECYRDFHRLLAT